MPPLSRHPDLAELKSTLAHLPVVWGVPRLELSFDSCQCHWNWQVSHPACTHTFVINGNFRGERLLELWEWLWECTHSSKIAVQEWGEEIDQVCIWGLEPQPDGYIQGWFRLQSDLLEGFVFRCDRAALIAHLSDVLQTGLQSPAFQPRLRDVEPIDELIFQATAREWPWNMFPNWYDQREERAEWQAQWQMVKLLSERYPHSLLFQQIQDPIDTPIFTYFWVCTLVALLEQVHQSCPYTHHALIAPALAQFEKEREGIREFIEIMDLAWRHGEFYSGFGDGHYYTQYESQTHREATAHKHTATLKRWVAQLLSLTQQAIPDLTR